MQTKNEQIMVFQFSENKQQVRNILIEQKPWFVAKDICDVLGIQNNRLAIKDLDEDEKLMYKIHTSGQNRDTWLISESGLYALIFKSNKPFAKVFRKWITNEVIPALLKKGYYAMGKQHQNDFIDARDIPYTTQDLKDYPVRCIKIPNIGMLFSVNDINRAIHSATTSNQIAKKLNAKVINAYKVWIFGNTHPSWFTNANGMQLIISGSRILKSSNQLKLSL
ncbi:BRO-N domain-containing protein [Capnocytophaga canis]|uniref:BRO-N domain-containing protein n=1 Tax=Capnocytophaga canis TaxID=1848903 RepID=UPI00385E60E5